VKLNLCIKGSVTSLWLRTGLWSWVSP